MLISKSNGDYVPNLTTLAQQQFDMIMPVGFLMADATNTVATQGPDGELRDRRLPGGRPEGQAEERRRACSSRSRRRATSPATSPGLWAKDNNAKVVSTVGGQKIPPVDHYIAGFQAGAKKAGPRRSRR